jgi:hypothetical protein
MTRDPRLALAIRRACLLAEAEERRQARDVQGAAQGELDSLTYLALLQRIDALHKRKGGNA